MDQTQLLLQILAKLESLEKRIETLEKKEEELTQEENKQAVFASLRRVEELTNRLKDVRAQVQPLLEKAADAAIEHYKVQPPKRR
ncbi:MAG: hypothetical protein ACTSPB_10335 [Candidatus Thorarchaeota archaeon]